MTGFRSVTYRDISPYDTLRSQDADLDFITHDIFHQPTLTPAEIVELLHIVPFYEGALYAS